MTALLYTPFPSRSSRLAWLALGVFAVLLQLAVATGLVHRGGAGKTFVAELCTVGGLVSQGDAPAGGAPKSHDHDCCTLCGVAVPPLAAVSGLSPTLHESAVASIVTVAGVRLPYPAWAAPPPRGPPAFS